MSFDFDRVREFAPAPAATAERGPAVPLGWLSELLGFFTQPLVAVPVAVVLLALVTSPVWRTPGGVGDAPQRVAEQGGGVPRSQEPMRDPPGSEAVALAERDDVEAEASSVDGQAVDAFADPTPQVALETAGSSKPGIGEDSKPADVSPPTWLKEDASLLAEVQNPAANDASRDEAGTLAKPSELEPVTDEIERREVVLLAALHDLGPPRYVPDAGLAALEGIRLSSQGLSGPMRGSAAAARVVALAPDHIGLTYEAQPTLWWFVSGAAGSPISLIVTEPEETRPLVDWSGKAPEDDGYQSLDLGTLEVELQPGVDYRWHVSIVVDPERPSHDIVSSGVIRRAAPSDSILRELSGAPASRGHDLAEAGIWYDAVDAFRKRIVEYPGDEVLEAQAAALLEAGAVTGIPPE